MSATAARMTTAEVLRKALERFGPSGESWANFHGLGVPPRLNCFCAETVFFNLGHQYDWDLKNHAIGILMAAVGVEPCDESRLRNLNHWNDAPERTWPEVKAAFEKAIELAEATQ